jgi:hypothetical protein
MNSTKTGLGLFFSPRIVLFCAALYASMFYINNWLTQFIEAAPGVSWIYLPAGLRLFLVLIFGLSGAIGIALSSVIITFYRDLGTNVITIVGIGLISGFAPYLARYLVMRNLKIDADLGNLNIQIIFLCILIFATLSSTLHQAWFELMGLESGSLKNTFIMFFGDILGSLLLISITKLAIDLYKRFLISKSFFKSSF